MFDVGGPDLTQHLDAKVPGALEQARRDATNHYLVELPALREWAFDAERAHLVGAPILYVTYEHDAMANQAEAWWPAMEYHVVGVSHMFPIEASSETAQRLAEFLAQHPM